VVLVSEEKENIWHFSPSEECCPTTVGFRNSNEPNQV
jgi:hypothetical protein